MKRNEVVDEIIDMLEQDTDPKYVDTDYYVVANGIVNYLERVGAVKPWDIE